MTQVPQLLNLPIPGDKTCLPGFRDPDTKTPCVTPDVPVDPSDPCGHYRCSNGGTAYIQVPREPGRATAKGKGSGGGGDPPAPECLCLCPPGITGELGCVRDRSGGSGRGRGLTSQRDMEGFSYN